MRKTFAELQGLRKSMPPLPSRATLSLLTAKHIMAPLKLTLWGNLLRFDPVMVIGLDIHGVLADFITPFLQLLETRLGSGPIDPASITDPNFQHHPFLTRETVMECMERASYDPAFWRRLAPLPSPEEWRALDDLSARHHMMFVTHRWVRDTYDIHQVTCDWLRLHGVRHPIVHFTQDKKSVLVRELNIGLFVDDRHENCHDVASETDAVVFMPHRPYNQAFDHPKVRRIQQLDELFDYLTDK